jgi:hypothetical protein
VSKTSSEIRIHSREQCACPSSDGQTPSTSDLLCSKPLTSLTITVYAPISTLGQLLSFTVQYGFDSVTREVEDAIVAGWKAFYRSLWIRNRDWSNTPGPDSITWLDLVYKFGITEAAPWVVHDIWAVIIAGDINSLPKVETAEADPTLTAYKLYNARRHAAMDWNIYSAGPLEHAVGDQLLKIMNRAADSIGALPSKARCRSDSTFLAEASESIGKEMSLTMETRRIFRYLTDITTSGQSAHNHRSEIVRISAPRTRHNFTQDIAEIVACLCLPCREVLHAECRKINEELVSLFEDILVLYGRWFDLRAKYVGNERLPDHDLEELACDLINTYEFRNS